MPERMLAPRPFDEDAAHRLGGGSEEMAATLPILILGTCQAQPRLMDESRGLKSVSRGFVRHFLRGQPAQLIIDER